MSTSSLRVNFNNESWAEKTPLELEQSETTNQIYEATLGGYILKDHLWFFLAGRNREEDAVDQTIGTNITYPAPTTEDRYEIKLTAVPHVSHRILLSYFDRETVEQNRDPFGTALDLDAVGNVTYPQSGASATYNGVITENFFVELIGNNDSEFERTYDGLHFAAQYRVGDSWQIGGTYTWSELTGNLNGENSGSGPIQGKVELYLQPEVINIFNADGVVEVNGADITVAGSDPTGQLQDFNPFTETPVQGTHWDFGENFGEPTSTGDFQDPRTFRVSVGVRF